MNLSAEESSRLKRAHDYAVMEYAQDWEGMLTLRLGWQNETALLKELVTYFKRSLPRKYKLRLYRSVYIHTLDSDIHAHCYVAHEWSPKQNIGTAEIDAMKQCWLETTELSKVSEAKKRMSSSLYFDYKDFALKGAEHGNYGSYGAKSLRNSEHRFEASELQYRDEEAHKRVLEYMKKYGHTTDYQNIVLRG